MLGRIRSFLNGLPRRGKSLVLVAFDAVALLVVLWASYQLRLGGTFAPNQPQLLLMLLAPLIALPVFLRFGLYHAVIRYLPERAIWTILQAMLLATLLWVFVLFIAEAARFGVLPRSIPIFYFMFGAVIVGGARFAARFMLWEPRENKVSAVTMLIYGAGEAGRQLATALRTRGGGGLVAGFIDDDRQLHGRDVVGLRVYPPAQLEALIHDLGVSEVILSIPSLDAPARQRIIAELNRLPVQIRTLPDRKSVV